MEFLSFEWAIDATTASSTNHTWRKGIHEGNCKEATPYVRGPNDERRCLVTGLLLDDFVYVGWQQLACRVAPDVRESWNPSEIANDLLNRQHNHHEVARATERRSPVRRWRSG